MSLLTENKLIFYGISGEYQRSSMRPKLKKKNQISNICDKKREREKERDILP